MLSKCSLNVDYLPNHDELDSMSNAAILAVDDNAANRFVLQQVLEPLGYEVIEAKSGMEALRRLLERDFAVILLDVHMPDMNGFETARLIRQRLRSANTPILFLTAINKQESHVLEGYALGAVDYLFKPFEPEILRAKVSVFATLYNQREAVRAHTEKIIRLESEARIKDEEHQRILIEKQAAEKLAEKSIQLSKQAEALQLSNTELEQFAFIASHDLKEPLRKILYFGSFLSSGEYGELTDKGKEFLGYMQDAAERMRMLLDNLLLYSRVTSRAKPFESIDLNEVMQGVLSDLELSIKENTASINVDPLPTIEADESQIRQLFQNLIENSLKYRKEGTKPKIDVSHTIDESENMCRISFKDNGIGFEPKYKEKIFEVFKRLHHFSQYSGTGVGLAICRKIVDRHNGKIFVDSELGKGANFTVCLPVKSQAQQA